MIIKIFNNLNQCLIVKQVEPNIAWQILDLIAPAKYGTIEEFKKKWCVEEK